MFRFVQHELASIARKEWQLFDTRNCFIVTTVHLVVRLLLTNLAEELLGLNGSLSIGDF